MIQQEALSHLGDGEGLTVEYKEAKNAIPKDIYETVVAFSNRNGGYIYLGVQNNGKIVGVEKDKIAAMKKDFATSVNNLNKITPPLYLSLEELEIDGKTILFSYVPISSQVHRLNQNKILDRNSADGDIDVTNNTHAVHAMFMRKDTAFTENRIYPYLVLDDFRSDLIERVRKGAAITRPDHPFTEMDDFELMKSLGMYRKDLATQEEGFSLAAILCFGKDVTIASTVNYWRIDVLERINNRERYDSRLNIQTNLIDTYYEIMAFIQKQASLPERFILEGTERVNARNILFRELVVNMLVHRELSNAFVSTISIYPERVEVANANKPINPGVITEPIISPHPKNPTIAKVFIFLGIIDEIGSGIGKIFKYGKMYFDSVPVIENESLFKVIINKETSTLSPENINPNIAKTKNDNQKRSNLIMAYINQHEIITNKEAKKLLKVSDTTARKILNDLVLSGEIKWIGASSKDPNQHYVINESGTFDTNLH